MRLPHPSPTLVIACLALLLAAGGVSYATVKATGQAVNITDPNSAGNVAKVDGSGRLMVGDNSGPLTVDGAVTASDALPKNFAKLNLGTTSSQDGVCYPVGFPSGKALVIKSIFVDIATPPDPPSEGTYWTLRKGAACSGPDIVAEHPGTAFGGKTIELDPGYAVPASAAGISLFARNLFTDPSFVVETYVYGYWLSASAVPAADAASGETNR